VSLQRILMYIRIGYVSLSIHSFIKLFAQRVTRVQHLVKT